MDNDGTTQKSQRAMEAIVQEFYTDLFRSSITVPKCLMPPAEEAPPILLFPEWEVLPQLVRAGGSVCSLLAKHFNHYLRLGWIPDSWKKSKTVLIFEKGQQD
ncbi:unnamed protein product [Heligmosomoides polygyrus]|uniref:Exocyst subunit Exo70 family protein n=1 Tax=Heligmosomoides polygyrus TaxID=6339 RepID=A0A183F4X2_HELPZ|nr:unnamed protein product [Heligmosomoides polygyrus]